MRCVECGKLIIHPEKCINGYGPVCYEKKFGKKPKDIDYSDGLPDDYEVPGQISIFEIINETGYN